MRGPRTPVRTASVTVAGSGASPTAPGWRCASRERSRRARPRTRRATPANASDVPSAAFPPPLTGILAGPPSLRYARRRRIRPPPPFDSSDPLRRTPGSRRYHCPTRVTPPGHAALRGPGPERAIGERAFRPGGPRRGGIDGSAALPAPAVIDGRGEPLPPRRSGGGRCPPVDPLHGPAHQPRTLGFGQAPGPAKRLHALLVRQQADGAGPVRPPHAAVDAEAVEDAGPAGPRDRDTERARARGCRRRRPSP